MNNDGTLRITEPGDSSVYNLSPSGNSSIKISKVESELPEWIKNDLIEDGLNPNDFILAKDSSIWK
jgi:hypothetical protein